MIFLFHSIGVETIATNEWLMKYDGVGALLRYK
jgi:hypothetical protein